MSFGARLSIAIILIAAGTGFYMAAVSSDADLRPKLLICAAICAVGLACCFPGKHSAVTNRIIGGVIFLIYVAYLVAEIKERKWFSSSRAVPCVLNALLGLAVWGLPAGYVMIYGHLWWNPFEKPRHDSEEDMTGLDGEDEPENDGGPYASTDSTDVVS